MKKVVEILLASTDDNVIYKRLEERFGKSHSPYKIYVNAHDPFYPDYRTPKGFLNKFAKGWTIHLGLDDSTIGEISRVIVSDKVLLSFMLENSSHRNVILELAESIIAEIRFFDGKLVNKRIYTPEGKLLEDTKINAPKRKATLMEHKTAWRIIQQMRNEQKKDFYHSKKDEIKTITLGEYRDRITAKMKKTYSEKQISRIIEEGEAGLLD
jgi:hypothetical protein